LEVINFFLDAALSQLSQVYAMMPTFRNDNFDIFDLSSKMDGLRCGNSILTDLERRPRREFILTLLDLVGFFLVVLVEGVVFEQSLLLDDVVVLLLVHLLLFPGLLQELVLVVRDGACVDVARQAPFGQKG
jgi:hypothetical protein